MSDANAKVNGSVEKAVREKLASLSITDRKGSENNNEKPPKRTRLPYEEREKLWQDEQAAKSVIEEGVTGIVKWYSVRAHYGFIERDDGKGDVFVHQNAITKSRIRKFFFRTLGEEEKVVFDVVKGKKGVEAANVTGPGGKEVLGSRFFKTQFFRPATKKSTSETTDDEAKGDAAKKKGRVARRRVHEGSAKTETGGDKDAKATPEKPQRQTKPKDPSKKMETPKKDDRRRRTDSENEPKAAQTPAKDEKSKAEKKESPKKKEVSKEKEGDRRKSITLDGKITPRKSANEEPKKGAEQKATEEEEELKKAKAVKA